MESTAHGFWSYVRKDDEGMHGAIRRLAENLIAEYEVLSGGDELDLFFDRVSLKWGDEWRSRIGESLKETTFFIPIITPRFFKSEECRNELLSFASQATELGLERLIMPIYFADVPGLGIDSEDPAIRLVAERNREDWRNLRLLDETVQPYKVAVNRLATQLLDLTRSREPAPSPVKVSEDKSDESSDGSDEGRSGTDTAGHAEPTQPREESRDRQPGIMELLAEGEDALPRLGETLGAIGPRIEEVGTLARSATEEIHQSDAAGKGFRGRLAVMNRLAKNLTEPADKLEGMTSRYAADLLLVDPAVRELIRLLKASPSDDPADVADFFDAIRQMVDASGEAAQGIEELIKSFEAPENFSRELDVPLKRMRVSLQSMLDGHQMIESWRTQVDQ